MINNTILAIDASTEALSIALHVNGQTFHHFEECPQQHSQKILPLVDKLLQQADCKLTDLDVIGFGQGPGSFTGVRIGVAIAQGLGYAAKVPLVGVSTLAIMAAQANLQLQADNVYAAIDARMDEVYFGHYQFNQGKISLVADECVIKPDLLVVENKLTEQDAVAVGTGFQRYPEIVAQKSAIQFAASITLPDAQYMLNLVNQAFIAGQAVPASEAQPKYVRDTVTWKKLPGRE